MPHINDIEHQMSHHLQGLSFLVPHKFRDSISTLRLYYCKSMIGFESQQINVLNSLAQFKQLTRLIFFNQFDINLTLFNIQDMCPNLKYLMFVNNCPIPEKTLLHALDKRNRINPNFISSLRLLDLYLTFMSASCARYLADYFPGQLSKISITIGPQEFFSWIDIVGMKLALKFFEKMGKIKEAFISFRQYVQYEVRDGDKTNITKYFTLLNAFRGNRHTHCKARLKGYDCDNQAYYSFEYDINGNLIIIYAIYPNDFTSSSIGLNLPDKNISIIGPEIFNDLELLLSGTYDNVVYRALKYSLNCFNIQRFYLKVYTDIDKHEDAWCIEYKNKKGLTFPDSSDHSINFLKMKLISPVQTYFDLLTTRLRDIEFIDLKTEDQDRFPNDSIMDLTKFKKLKLVVYKTEQLSAETNDDDRKDKFVLFKYTNGEEHYRYMDEEKNKDHQVEYSKNSKTPSLTVICDASVSFYFL